MNNYGRDKDIQIKVGIMTIIIIIILFFGYSWLRDWFNRDRYEEMKVIFTNAGNIEVGSPVTVFGIKAGRVNAIEMNREGVILTLLLEIDFPLPIDTKFVVTDSNLMGSRQIDVYPGRGTTYITPGFIAQGESLSSLSSLIPKIDGVISEINSLVSLLTKNDSLPNSLMETIETTHKIAIRIDNILESNEEDLGKAIANFQNTTKQLNELLTDNKDNLTEAFVSTKEGMEQFELSMAKLDGIFDTLEPLMEAISKDEGTIQKMITEEELYDKIVKATERADSLLVDIKNNPKRYFKFSIF